PDLEFPTDKPVAPYRQAFDTFVESVKEADVYARSRGVRLAIENNVLAGYNMVNGENPFLLCCRADEFEELAILIPSSNVGILLDLGHLQVSAHWLGFDKYEFIEQVKNRVFAIHVHDNDGLKDEHRMLENASWCLEVIAREYFADLPVVLESQGLSMTQISKQVALLEKHIVSR
ncbi:unnamed protein product, partial [marine sediment metagenome]